MRLLKNISINNRYGTIVIISVLFLFIIWPTMLINGTKSTLDTQIKLLSYGKKERPLKGRSSPLHQSDC